MNIIEELAEQSADANRRYHALGTPLLSDAEYDALVDKLQELAPEHPVLQQVGNRPAVDGVLHTTPMLSLQKAYTEEEVRAWMATMPPGSETPPSWMTSAIMPPCSICRLESSRLVAAGTSVRKSPWSLPGSLRDRIAVWALAPRMPRAA